MPTPYVPGDRGTGCQQRAQVERARSNPIALDRYHARRPRRLAVQNTRDTRRQLAFTKRTRWGLCTFAYTSRNAHGWLNARGARLVHAF